MSFTYSFFLYINLTNNNENDTMLVMRGTFMNEMSGSELKVFFENQPDEFIMDFFVFQNELELDVFLIGILSIKNEDLRYKMFDKYSVFFREFDLKAFKKLFTDEELADIAYEFLDKMKSLSIHLKAIFVVATQNEELLLKYFSEAITDEDKMEYIKNVHYRFGYFSELEQYLISNLHDERLKYLLNSNSPDKREMYLTEGCKVSSQSISSGITIGVELETTNENINLFKNMPCLFGRFDVKSDTSVKSGFEIVSSIMHYNQKDLAELEAVCTALQKCGFATDDTCGGHIHIGASYLQTKEDYAMLLYLFTNCEDIIYKISDRSCSQKRLSIEKYASKIKDRLLISLSNGDLDNAESFSDYIKALKNIMRTRHCGLNLQNINKPEKNTIEFRMANGEIDYKELLANINLFARLIQISHDLNTFDENYYKVKYAQRIGQEPDEERRFEFLLALLFDDEKEKEIYRERYATNSRIMELIDGDSIAPAHELIGMSRERKLCKKTI